MSIIRKKILPEYFEAVQENRKKFELRKDDDNIQVGDEIMLEEWDGEYTCRYTRRKVTYVLRNVPEYGLNDGYCIIGWC